jgi:nucleoside-diphosphate-sugar epimerase
MAKAERELHWRPMVSPEEGINRLIDWIDGEKDIFTGACHESLDISCR